MTYTARAAVEPLESRLAMDSAAPAAVAPPPRPDHVVIVVEENKSFNDIIGYSGTPYINSLAAEGALLTSYYGVTYPSQPNYIAMFSGSTQGVDDNSTPHTFTAPSLGGQLIAAGFDFGGYSQSLPYAGFTGGSSGDYKRKHNPWVNFTDVPASDNLPFTAFPEDFSKLPDVAFVVPDQEHDMHDGTRGKGDRWLRDNLDPYVQWAKTHNSLFILTFDEDDHDENNRVATLLVGPMVKPGRYDTRVDHYSLLRMLEDMYGLSHLGHAATATPITGMWRTAGEDPADEEPDEEAPPTRTLVASEDAYVFDDAPDRNFGSAVTLDVKTKAGATGLNRDAYLKFDLSGAGAVGGAKLRFYGALSGAGRVATSVFGVGSNWSESGLTWATRQSPRLLLGTVTVGST